MKNLYICVWAMHDNGERRVEDGAGLIDTFTHLLLDRELRPRLEWLPKGADWLLRFEPGWIFARSDGKVGWRRRRLWRWWWWWRRWW